MRLTERARGRPAAAASAVAIVLACVGVGAWARAGDPGAEPPPVTQAVRENPVPSPSTTRPRPATTRAPATALPVPEPAPADPYAPTPEVVHGTLALPSIGVTAPLGEGVTLTAIDRAPSHWPGTALPGQPGNVVVAGHRVTHTRPFHDLDLLQPGDPLVFTMNDGATWTYTLDRVQIVDDEAMHIVDQTPAPTATLFACHPKGSAAQRIVAHFVLAGR